MTDAKNWIVRKEEVLNTTGHDVVVQHYLVFPLPNSTQAGYLTSQMSYATKMTYEDARIECDQRKRCDAEQGLPEGVASRTFTPLDILK